MLLCVIMSINKVTEGQLVCLFQEQQYLTYLNENGSTVIRSSTNPGVRND